MKQAINRRISLKICIGLLFSTLLLLYFCIKVYAAGGSYQEVNFLSRTKVYSGGDNYIPDLNEYPYNSSGTVTAIGFDSLYGAKKGFIDYKGEVPYDDRDNDWAKNYRYFNGTKLGGITRNPWVLNDSGKIDGNGTYKDNGNDWKDASETTDLHALGLTTTDSDFFGLNIGAIGLWIVNALYWVTSSIVKLVITINTFDLGALISAIDSNGKLAQQLASLFAIDPNTGAISPFLIFGGASFLICFISICVKIVTGKQGTGRQLFNEFGFFLIAVVLCAFYFTGTNVSKMSNFGVDFLKKLSIDLATSSNSTTAVFKYATGDLNADTGATQKALINKIYIDQIIKAQFGYSVDELYIQDANGNDSFGGTADEAMDLIAHTSFNINTSTNGNSVNNLGYFWWAANSGVATSGETSSVPFYKSGGSYYVNTSNSDRVLFVIDFLNYVKNQEGQSTAVQAKVDKIFNTFTDPNYGSACLSILIVCVENLCLAYCLLFIMVFCLIGQCIIVFGSYAMVVMPAMILFPKTRDIARGMSYTYLLGFLRFLIGSALFSAAILVNVILCQSGIPGIILSCFVSIGLGKFAPNIIQQINLKLSDWGRGKELSGMSRFYHGMNNKIDNYSWKSRRERRAKTKVLDENGNWVERGTRASRIQEGIRKGQNPFKSSSSKLSKEEMIDNLNTVDNAEISFRKDYTDTIETVTTTTTTDTTSEQRFERKSATLIAGVNTTKAGVTAVSGGLNGNSSELMLSSSTNEIDNANNALIGTQASASIGVKLEAERTKETSNVRTTTTQVVDTQNRSNSVAGESSVLKLEFGKSKYANNKVEGAFDADVNPEKVIKKAQKQADKERKKLNKKIAFASKFSSTLAEGIAAKAQQESKHKEELKQEIIKNSVKKVNSLNDGEEFIFDLNEQTKNARESLLSNTAHASREARGKSFDKARESFTKADIEQIQREISKQLNIKDVKNSNHLKDNSTTVDSNNDGGTIDW